MTIYGIKIHKKDGVVLKIYRFSEPNHEIYEKQLKKIVS